MLCWAWSLFPAAAPAGAVEAEERELEALWSQASAAYDNDDYEQARDLYQQLVDLAKNILPPDHPDTLLAQSNLASTYFKLGEHQKALELDRQVLENSQLTRLIAELKQLSSSSQELDLLLRTLEELNQRYPLTGDKSRKSFKVARHLEKHPEDGYQFTGGGWDAYSENWPDDAAFLNDRLKQWSAVKDSNLQLHRDLGLTDDQALVKELRRLLESFTIAASISRTGSDPLGVGQCITALDSLAPQAAVNPGRLVLEGSYSNSERISGPVAVSPDSRYFLLVNSGAVIVFGGDAGQEIWRSANEYGYAFFWRESVIAVGFRLDDAFTVTKHDLISGRVEKSIIMPTAHDAWDSPFAGFSPDGKWAAIDCEEPYQVLNLETLEFEERPAANVAELRYYYGIRLDKEVFPGNIYEESLYENINAKFSFDLLLTGPADPSSPMEIRSGKHRHPLSLPPAYQPLTESRVAQYIFSGDGRYCAVASTAGELFIFSLAADGKPTLHGVYSLSVWPDEEPAFLALRENPRAKLPELMLRLVKPLEEIQLEELEEWEVASYTGNHEISLCLFDETSPSCRPLTSAAARIAAVAEYGPGKLLAAFSNGAVHSLNLLDGTVDELAGPSDTAWTKAIAVPEAALALLLSKGGSATLNLSTGERKYLPLTAAQVTGACFSGDGRTLFVAADDGLIFKITDNQQLEPVTQLASPAFSLVSDAAGERLWFLRDAEAPSSAPPGRTVSDDQSGRLWFQREYDISYNEHLDGPDGPLRSDLGLIQVGTKTVKPLASLSGDRTELYWDETRSSALALSWDLAPLSGGHLISEMNSDDRMLIESDCVGRMTLKGIDDLEADGLRILSLQWTVRWMVGSDQLPATYVPSRRMFYAPGHNGDDYAAGVSYYLTDTGLGPMIRHSLFETPPYATFTIASPYSNLFLVPAEMRTAYNFVLTNTDTGSNIQEPVNPLFQTLPVTGAIFLKDQPRLVTYADSGLITLWDMAEPKAVPLLNWLFLKDGNWVAMDESGRFDARDVGNLDGLHWVHQTRPGEPIAFEAFMRDYYQPRLAEYVLNGAALPPAPDLSTRNTFQHEVTITEITPDPDAPERVAVTVEISGLDGRTVHPAQDLKLFRDGRMVSKHPGDNGRDGVLALPGGVLRHTFTNIPLPLEQGRVSFSAYTFNEDRVRSRQAAREYQYPATPARPRLFLVSVGITEFDNPAWNLRYAANDAQAFTAILPRYLPAPGGTAVDILASGGEIKPDKEALRRTLLRLSGVSASGEPAPFAARSGPDDVVVLTVASHGLTADNTFYILPADIPGQDRRVTPELLSRAISADDLQAWLANLDAKEIVLILDTCQSGAALGGEGFKPGPMGDRGLGQLAYDKAMRVLSATNENSAALEYNQLRHGLLSYTLLREGLEKGQAAQPGAVLTLRDWLIFGLNRTTEMYRQIAAGRDPGADRGVVLVDAGAGPSSGPVLGQVPQLFDMGGHSAVLSLTPLPAE